MKTYILDSFNRLKSYSQSLDAKAMLCNKAWVVYNKDGIKEVWKFKHDGTMSIALSGEFQIRKWNYDSSDNSVNIMTSDSSGVCIKPVVYNGFILGFRQDGTDHDLVMIDENKMEVLKIQGIKDLLEVESKLLNEAYSQTSAGKIAIADKKRKEEKEKIDLKKKLSDEMWKSFGEELTPEDIEKINKITEDTVTSRLICISPLIALAFFVFFGLLQSNIGVAIFLIAFFISSSIFVLRQISDFTAKRDISNRYNEFLHSKGFEDEDCELMIELAWTKVNVIHS